MFVHCSASSHTFGMYYQLQISILAEEQISCIDITMAPCGLRGCKNGPAPFPGRMSYKATKPGLVFVLCLSMFIIVFGVY